MTGDESVPTRRRLLASLGGVGGLTAAAGARTTALFTDEEKTTASLQAGQIELDVDCDGCTLADGRLHMALEAISPGELRKQTVHLAVPDHANPVRLWGRTECPPVGDPLGEVLETRLSVRPDCAPDARRFPLGDGWMSLTALRRALHAGVRLDDSETPCLATGELLCLDFEYRLSADATWTVDAETELVLELFAQQCRHVSEDKVGSGPFPDADCPTVKCPDCVELGKLEVKNDRLEPGIYDFDEVYNGSGTESPYQLEVLTVTDKVDETERETVCASIRLLKAGRERDAPPICKVAVKGGNQTVQYDVDPPLTRTRGEVCASSDAAESATESDGRRPAISTLTVFVCSEEVDSDE